MDTLTGGPSGVCTYRKICVFCASVTILNGFPGGECGVYLPELQREGLQSPEVAGRLVLFIPLPKSSLRGCKVLLTLGPQVHWRCQEIVCWLPWERLPVGALQKIREPGMDWHGSWTNSSPDTYQAVAAYRSTLLPHSAECRWRKHWPFSDS